MPLTFILSQGRTATVFMSHFMSALPGVTSCHERNGLRLRMIYHGYYRKMRKKIWLDKITKKIWELFKIDKYALRLICDDLYKLDRKEGNVHIEINNMIKYYVYDVLRKFPDANFIHIVRDPRTHAQSGVNRSYDKKINRFHISFLNRFLKLYFPYWSPRPIKYFKEKKEIDKLFEITVINWVECNKAYYDIRDKTSNYHLIKFEDFVKDPLQTIQKILRISGYKEWANDKLIEKEMKRSEKNKSQRKLGHWKDWDNDYIMYIKVKCDKLMRKFGYGDEEEWRKRVENSNKNEKQ